jgi:MarR-like DNA-binding transcriptional regulator SgrR of sgrS sRNA
MVSKEISTPVATAPASVAFVHNFLDEYGLDPYEFRVYAHVVRRTGGKPNKVCFASLTKIAAICQMSVRKAQQSLKVLLEANLISQTKRKGRTDEYRVIPASEWVPSKQLEEIRKAVASGRVKEAATAEEVKTNELNTSMQDDENDLGNPF